MKDPVVRSNGMETLITEVLGKIKSTDPLRLVKKSVCRNREGSLLLWTGQQEK
jgi:hypothetical protein